IRFAQYPDDLLFAVPALLHANSSSEEPLSPDQAGPRIPGQVSTLMSLCAALYIINQRIRIAQFSMRLSAGR
ncbi:MAG: hypothetical protein WC736_16565, partial [Gallionella sp.]